MKVYNLIKYILLKKIMLFGKIVMLIFLDYIIKPKPIEIYFPENAQ